MIAAVHTETPELSPKAAARLAQADQELTKYNYNPEEPRDWHGRWTKDGSSPPATLTAPVTEPDNRTALTDDRPRRVAENTFPPGGSVSSDAAGSSSDNMPGAPADGDNSRQPNPVQHVREKIRRPGAGGFLEESHRVWLLARDSWSRTFACGKRKRPRRIFLPSEPPLVVAQL